MGRNTRGIWTKRPALAGILNLKPVAAGILAGSLLWGAANVSSPHPGLKDDALKQALKKERKHEIVPFGQAKMLLYSKIDNHGGYVIDRYTGQKIKTTRVPLPHIAQIDHAFARTKLTDVVSQSDMHQLFIVDSEARLARNVLPFCDVFVPAWEKGGSRAGVDRRAHPCFEPRDDQKGDAARAMFYTSVFYDIDIDPAQEATLRKWNDRDRVDGREKSRNDAIAKSQKSRNPFVDHPELVKRITDF